MSIQRFRTHIQTDKDIYKPKDTLYMRGFILNAFNHSFKANAPDISYFNPSLSIISPKGDKVFTGLLPPPTDSILYFQWPIPEEQEGGDYKIEVTYPHHDGYAFAERGFNIRVFRPPRLKSEIQFVKKGYGAGEKAQAKLDVERAEGGYPAGATVTAIARIDGSEAFRGTFKIDDAGKCLVEFTLPQDIETGVGTLSCVIEDGGVVETASKTIPILLRAMDINIYPEGGDLVAGLESGLYIEAFTPVGDPADITAEIVDESDSSVVGKVNTDHEGRGKTVLTPIAGRAYHLKVVRPSGIVKTVQLPLVKKSGVTLTAVKEIYQFDEPVEVVVRASEDRDYWVHLHKLDKEVSKVQVKCTGQKPVVTRFPKPEESQNYAGVLRVTIYEDGEALKPIAERLIFRKPKDELEVTITHDKKSYIPGGNVSLTVKTTVAGKPVKAKVGVTVTDDSVRKMTEKRKRAPRLLPMVFLEDEVHHLEDAHVYFKKSLKKPAKAAHAIDLLLGTQGWRRFVYTRVGEEMTKDKKRTERLLADHKAEPQKPVFRGGFGGGPPGAPPLLGAPAPFLMRSSGVDGPVPAPPLAVGPPRPNAAAAPPPARAAPVAVGPPAPIPIAPSPKAAPPPAPAAPAVARPLAPPAPKAVPSVAPMAVHAGAPPAFSLHFAPPMGMPMPIFGISNVGSYVTVYAHKVRPNRNPTERIDFAETLYWSAFVNTDANGEAKIEFGLNDSVTSFVVTADAFGAEGTPALGQSELVFDSRQPFYLEPKLPLEVTCGDVIELPIAVINNTECALDVKRSIKVTNGPISARAAVDSLRVRADARVRQIATLDVLEAKGGSYDIEFGATTSTFNDKVTRSTRVMPTGFPFQLTASGLLSKDASLDHAFTLTEGTIMSSIRTEGYVFTSPIGNMTQALQTLIQEPFGCFEQTSSTVYPLVMAQKYFQTHTGVDPTLIERADAILQKGYKTLTGFECKKGGFDWFGNDPASEPLTAFAILEFTEMSRVLPGVDPALIKRCEDWLLGRRDGKGSFEINPRVLHVWATDSLMSDAYVLYSLTKSGMSVDKIEKELAYLKERLDTNKDPYMLALYANILYYTKDLAKFTEVLDELTESQESDGSVKGAKTTVTKSQGKSLILETTSLAMLAWLKSANHIKFAANGAKYLLSNCELGGYSNTQSTVLGLEAIIEYDIATATPKSPSTIKLVVDGEVMATIEVKAGGEGKFAMPDFSEAVSLPGTHTVTVQQIGGSDINYSLAVQFSSTLPASSEECSVNIEHLALRNTEITEGEGTEVAVRIKNKNATEPLPMTMVIVGLPGGLDLRHEKMKELVKSEKLASYEVLGARRVACYFRHMLPGEEISFEIDVIAAVPGTYKGPASCAYLYYTNEYKHWIEGMAIKITPRS